MKWLNRDTPGGFKSTRLTPTPKMEEYKDVLVDGLPNEQGAYTVILIRGSTEMRYTILCILSDGRRVWAAGVGCQLPEEQIVMYRRIKEYA